MDRQEQPEDSHAVDIASLAHELEELIPTGTTETGHGGDSLACPIIIGKVGDGTRIVDPGEYVPCHVSIGPYHRATDLTRDEEKRRSLEIVLSSANRGVTVLVLLEELERIREQATRCYQHRKFEDMSNKDFLLMMLLDACYLLTLFSDIHQYATGRRMNHVLHGGIQSGGGSLVSAPAACSRDARTDVAVVRDVFYLAENQLPFFVIDSIYRQSKLEGSDSSAAVVISRYVQELMRRLQYSVAKLDLAKTPGPGNLLHLLHMHLKPTVPRSCLGGAATGEPAMGPWRTAIEYYNLAGVKFKKQTLCRGGCQSILDIGLVDGTLEIPSLNIDGNTWALLRNLIALEQQNPGTTGSDVTAYCSFISQLACTPADVEFLVRTGIISHTCGNHGRVAGFFSKLCNGVVDRKEDEENNYLRGTWLALEKRFESRHVRWMAWLRRKYFSNPWLTVGLAAAGVGLACAVVQAVYSVLSYKQ